MATAAQAAANQANSRHSTGPNTPEGKQNSSKNALKHGFRSSTCIVLPGDDPAEYDELLQSLTEHFTPSDLTEERHVREMAAAEYRLAKVRLHIEDSISSKINEISALYCDATPIRLQRLAIEALNQTKSSYTTWLRYESQFQRAYDRAYNAWTRYQDVRRRARTRRACNQIDEILKAPLPVPPSSAPDIPANTFEPNSGPEIPRNAPCPCGSGLKFKRCCGPKAPAMRPKAA